ncbi:RHS repeat domain-containing protein [Pseudomonas sp. Kh13]|uniref:RHS repeat domain-containing protein n=1 Tax=Pseudomonas sp. Kh13 TaxID=2093744 RepID=UPI001182712F|nr:RHS repeat protein [Pseudomonas sp. Kh13]
MSGKTALHSGAFNFSSFISNRVDPRTGQYGLSIVLPVLRGDYLGGAEFPLSLTYSSMGAGDFGYGQGWDINLSSFIEHAYPEGGSALSLYTGERFTVDGVESISEKKLDTFHFHKDGDEAFRVEHKAAQLTEVLKFIDIGQKKLALPTTIYSDSKRWLEFTYRDNPQLPGNPCLSEVHDSGIGGQQRRRLLLIEYPGDMIITLYPDQPGVRASYTLKFNGRQLKRVHLPTNEEAYWEFDYQQVHGQTCVSRVRRPTGALEHIEYGVDGDPGHKLPGVAQYVPRVKRHRIISGFGQAEQVIEYDYSSTNFVGNGSSVVWNNNGRDNLYDVTDANYSYWSKTTERCLGQADRTVLRTFDRFHRMVEEKQVQGDCVITTVTDYPGNSAEPFAKQPAHFQLQRLSTQKWQKANSGLIGQAEHATTYDLFGNLVSEVAATGVETLYEYFPAGGEPGKCPADPQGFVRWRKSQTIKPSPAGEGAAATERTEFVYKALDPVPLPEGTPDPVAKPWLVLKEEQAFVMAGEAKVPLSQAITHYHESQEDLLSYGRPAETIMTMDAKPTTTSYSYTTEVVENHPALVVTQVVTGFDHEQVLEDGTVRNVQKTFALKHSALTAEPLLNRDDNDVEIAYAYDLLGRVTVETVAPNDPLYQASRKYSYVLAVGDNPAVQTSTDVKGVTTRTLLDGLGRVYEEQRMEADSVEVWRRQQYRKSYSATYNAYGQLAEETEYDWMADVVAGPGIHQAVDLTLQTTYGYDDWGQQAWQRGPDGICHFEVTDPVGTEASARMPIRRSWRESADGTVASGVTETWLNRFDQATHVRRFKKNDDSVAYSLHTCHYDGLGRVAREVAADKSTTLSTYDTFGRLLTQTLPDGSVVTRRYATFDSGDLPESIDVDGIVLGTQAFDGLKRLYRSVTGGRERTLYYKPGHSRPEKVLTPSRQWVEYEYNPVLGEEPLKRASGRFTADYTYDPKNARLIRCTEDGQTLERDYFSTGQIKREKRIEGTETFEMTYDFSYRERMLSYTDVLGQVQSYQYDDAGRLQQTTLGSTVAMFEYDKLGRTAKIETRDGDNYLITQLAYDEFDREWLRRFDMKGEIQTLTQDYDECDRIELKTLWSGEPDDKMLRQAEAYANHVRGNLHKPAVTEQASKLLRDIYARHTPYRSNVIADPTQESWLRHEAYAYDSRGRLYDYKCSGTLSPVDPQGHVIRAQAFEFDALDNIILVITELTDKDTEQPGENVAEYFFEHEDPAQLSRITNSYEGYAPEAKLRYDDDGNLEDDGEGMEMDYDATGRLRSVVKAGVTSNYYYDGVDRLSGQS